MNSNPGAADYDVPYTWGRPPTTYLATRELVRLMILHAKLEAVRSERLHLTSPRAPHTSNGGTAAAGRPGAQVAGGARATGDRYW
jgi:hypothetical protein